MTTSTITRRLHTGAPGNGGKFATRTRPEPDISLARAVQAPPPSRLSRLGNAIGVSGLLSAGASIGLMAGYDLPSAVPAAAMLGSVAVIAVGANLGRRRATGTAELTKQAKAAAVFAEHIQSRHRGAKSADNVTDIQPAILRRERTAEFEKADRFALEFSAGA